MINPSVKFLSCSLGVEGLMILIPLADFVNQVFESRC